MHYLTGDQDLEAYPCSSCTNGIDSNSVYSALVQALVKGIAAGIVVHTPLEIRYFFGSSRGCIYMGMMMGE